MTLLIPRFLMTFILFIIAWIFVVIILIGLPKDTPLAGFRLICVTYFFKFLTRVGTLLVACCWVSLNYEQHVDYSKYLGNDQFNQTKASASDSAPTLVCTHTGALDVFAMLLKPNPPCYAAKDSISEMPVIGSLARALSTLFIVRGGT